MKRKTSRRKAPGAYHSPVREEQARETRRRIEDAARALLLERGFDAMTIDAVAKRAVVSAPTVYAAYGSKVGIVRAVLDRARFGSAYQDLTRQVQDEPDPVRRLRFPARFARQVYDAEREEMSLLSSAASLSAELAESERDRENRRYEGQAHLVEQLAELGQLGPSVREGRDILWALTSRDLYRLLVVERGWSADAYERWLTHQIETALLAPERPAKKKRATRR